MSPILTLTHFSTASSVHLWHPKHIWCIWCLPAPTLAGWNMMELAVGKRNHSPSEFVHETEPSMPSNAEKGLLWWEMKHDWIYTSHIYIYIRTQLCTLKKCKRPMGHHLKRWCCLCTWNTFLEDVTVTWFTWAHHCWQGSMWSLVLSGLVKCPVMLLKNIVLSCCLHGWTCAVLAQLRFLLSDKGYASLVS